MATTTSMNYVQKLYVAYYQRPADYAGQLYWAERMDKEGVGAIASAFAVSTEASALFSNQALGTQINAIYQAAFNRDADLAGLQYYINEVNMGRLSIGRVAVAVIDGAIGASDTGILNAKLAVAAEFTLKASTVAGILNYTGDANAVLARLFLKTVDGSNQAPKIIEATPQVAALKPVSSFVLTDGDDNFVGTTGNDTFTSSKLGGFGANDKLDGGAGTGDMLTVSDTAAINTAASQVIKGIEIASLQSSANVTADTSGWTDLTKLTVTGSGNISVTGATTTVATVTNSGAFSTTVAGTGGALVVTAGTAAVTIGGGLIPVANKLDSVSVMNGSSVTIVDRSGTAAATGSTLKTVTVNGASGATTITGDGLTTLNLTNLTGLTTANNTTVTAAAATRALTVNLNGVDVGGNAAADGGTTTITDATATSLSINAITAKSFDVAAVAGAATSVAVKADVDLQMDALTTGVAAAVSLMGAGKLTLSTAVGLGTATSVITSTNTGGVTISDALAVGQQFVGTGSSGNDVLSFAASATTANTTGAGNDLVTAGTFAAGFSVNGGDGTDTLSIDTTVAQAITVTTAANAANYTGFEILRVNNATAGSIDASKLVGVNTVNAHGGIVTATTLTIGATAATVGLGGDGAGTLLITAATAANSNTLALNNNGFDIAGLLTTTGYGTLNINSGTGAATVASTTTAIGAEVDTADFNAITMTGLTGGATGTINITGTNGVMTGAVITGATTINASGLTGAFVMNAAGVAAAASITGGAGADTLVGSTGADIIVGGAGADTIQNATSGANSAAGDTLAGGAGFDLYRLIGASASAANLTGSASITAAEFVVGTSVATSDQLVLDITNASYGAATNLAQQGANAITATAAGSVVVQSIAQNAVAAGATAGAQVYKLTTGVAFTTNLQTTFNNAIGTATVTTASATTSNEVFALLYDTASSRALVLLVDLNSAADTTLSTADTVTLVGSIGMTAADYANFGTNQIAFVDY